MGHRSTLRFGTSEDKRVRSYLNNVRRALAIGAIAAFILVVAVMSTISPLAGGNKSTVTQLGGPGEAHYDVTGTIRCLSYNLSLDSLSSGSGTDGLFPESNVSLNRGDGVCLIINFSNQIPVSNLTMTVPSALLPSEVPPPFVWLSNGDPVNYSLLGTTIDGPLTLRFVFGASATGTNLITLRWNDIVVFNLDVNVA